MFVFFKMIIKHHIRIWIFILLAAGTVPLRAQNHFYFSDSTQQWIRIPFHLVNNLILVKVEINGVPLQLVFDTGVKHTVLINLEQIDSLDLYHARKIWLSGLGKNKEKIPALYATGNRLEIGGLICDSSDVLMVTEAFKFSENLGEVIHGFIGTDLVKDYPVKIDFKHRKLVFYRPDYFARKKFGRYRRIPLTIDDAKPYIELKIRFRSKHSLQKIKVLMDTGASDALWLFQGRGIRPDSGMRSLRDYFGLGFSGEIYGLRTRASELTIPETRFRFRRPIVSFPDTSSLFHLGNGWNFDGIAGNELWRRFYVILNFPDRKLLLKKYPHNYHHSFSYNIPGLYLGYKGKIPIRFKRLQTRIVHSDATEHGRGSDTKVVQYYEYSYRLMDRIVISRVRRNSPAWKAGLRPGDVVLEINDENIYNYKLETIRQKFLLRNLHKWKFLVERNGLKITFHFTVNNPL